MSGCFRHSIPRQCWAIALALGLVGCATVGPDYKAPDTKTSAEWHTTLASNTTTSDAAVSSWWAGLNDPVLTSLIERALKGNHDLRTAVSRLRESRARLGMSKAGLYPKLDASGSATRSKAPQSGSVGESYSASLDASWEIDLFGGNRRAVEAAYADMESQREAMYGVRISTASEVAVNYINLRSYQRRLEMAGEKINALEQEARIIRSKKDAGFASELELIEAEGALHEAGARLPSLRAGLEESMNRLSVLLGLMPGELQADLSTRRDMPVSSDAISVGLPADLIRRRPDIRQAERRLASETARIGVSVSELYPKLRLGGSIGYRSSSAGTLFSSQSETYSVGPSVSLPLFSGGYIKRSIEAQKEVAGQALLAYEKTVLGALEEAENALAAYREAIAEAKSLRMALDALIKTESITRSLYEAGLRDYRTYLDIEMKRISMEDSLAVSEAQVAAGIVRLYKAIGGGWSADIDDMESIDKNTEETDDGRLEQ